MIVLLDHDDSFVYTLARYVTELGEEARVVRARHTTAAAVAAMGATHIILSPGPRTPRECPVALNIVRRFGSRIPILGICLGHQCVGAAYGAIVQRAAHPQHGNASMITHNGRGLFAGIPSPFRAARYHSLAVAASSIPASLEVTATSDDGEIMALRHRDEPVHGVQFHPESVLTEWGYRILANFLGRPDSSVHMAADSVAYPSGHAE